MKKKKFIAPKTVLPAVKLGDDAKYMEKLDKVIKDTLVEQAKKPLPSWCKLDDNDNNEGYW